MGNFKITKEDIKREALSLVMIFLGNLILACGVMVFVDPMNLMTGGATGLALLAGHLFNVPLSSAVAVLNVIMFIIGFILLGKRFAATTLLSTFLYPGALAILEQIPSLSSLNNDPLLAAVFGGLMIGGGVGLVIRQGASTGGMDIPPIVLQKKTGIPVAISMNLMDVVILATQVPFSNPQNALYSLVIILASTIIMDKVAMLGVTQTQVMVISEKFEEISQVIQEKIDRGTTLLQAISGYKKESKQVVMSVINNRQLHEFTKVVKAVDPHAFLIVNRVHEVHGNGFTLKLDDK